MSNVLKKELIAERLRTARIEKGYRSCRAFSEQNNFNERTYQRHEVGTSELSFSAMLQYCQALDISILWLQTGEIKYLQVPFSTSEKII